jgi:hypothetical protein
MNPPDRFKDRDAAADEEWKGFLSITAAGYFRPRLGRQQPVGIGFSPDIKADRKATSTSIHGGPHGPEYAISQIEA